MPESDGQFLERFDRAPHEASREVFFFHFDKIERMIRSRLCLSGLNYGPESEHFNSVIDHVYQRVYEPDSLRRALRDFDPETGSLENWLLGRVDFAVRDWLKRVHTGLAQAAGGNPDVGAQSTPTEPDDTGCLEEVIAKLTPKQRAVVVLRLYPSRPLTDEERRLLCDVAGLSQEELQVELQRSQPNVPPAQISHREERLLAAMSLWLSRLRREERRRAWWREQLVQSGLDDRLKQVEEEAERCTQEEIRQQYSAAEAGTPESVRSRMLRQFSLACHEIGRCRRRLAQLRKEYGAAPVAALLQYQAIAEILRSTPQQVSANLHRARQAIEEECG